MSGDLRPADFAGYFRAVHGQAPFPWQQRLVDQVWERRRWPDLFDLPTACGKTAVIDAAVYLLAMDAIEPAERQWCPRRIAFVVDRRVVVDQAQQRAEHIRRCLDQPAASVVASVAEALGGCTGGAGVPLAVARLRGGVALDDTWARRPDQPIVLTTTVDQLGSRLLFQGYGVSRGMRPVQAGLLASDTLVVLDEVHLSQPFAQTLRALRPLLQHKDAVGADPRWHCTELSATPVPVASQPATEPDRGKDGNRWVFGLDPGDEDGGPPAEALHGRLHAAKPAALLPVRTSRRDEPHARQQLAEVAARVALEHAAHPEVDVVAAVVNRVDTARHIFAAIGDRSERVLLTGRMRPLERDQVVESLHARIGSDRQHWRPDGADTRRPLVVVATQCIEAGADFDFDALVTECASLDALRQRFGRVDRLGAHAARGAPTSNTILGPANTVAQGSEDPVYGGAIARTWTWLQQRATGSTVDFGVAALGPVDEPDLLPPHPDAPRLHPTLLDIWCETPLSATDGPPVAAWLHGPRTDADVSIVWRAELSRGCLQAASVGNGDADSRRRALGQIVDVLAGCRPLSTEALSVPVAAARAWLAQGDTIAVSDVEGAPGDGDEQDDVGGQLRPYVLWDGERTTVESRPGALRPGVTVVVPCEYGGLRGDRTPEGVPYRWWDPDGGTSAGADGPSLAANDLGDAAHRQRDGRRLLRLLPGAAPDGTPWVDPPPLPTARDESTSRLQHLQPWWDRNRQRFGGGPLTARAVREHRLTDPSTPSGERSWYAVDLPPTAVPGDRLTSSRAGADRGSADRGAADIGDAAAPDLGDVVGEPDTSSFTGVGTELGSHLAGVASLAADTARRCGLPEAVAEDIALAAVLHDVGKADERFQAWLNGGRPRAPHQPLLAKSATPAADRAARRQALQRSGYPAGARHEATSLAMVDGDPRCVATANDGDLVRHLVVSHHGWGRPFLPGIDDPRPVEVRYPHADGTFPHASSDHDLATAGSAVPERFWRLVARYGWYGLARIESVLRLADHRRSEQEQLDMSGGTR